jgi:hypothetical protein
VTGAPTARPAAPRRPFVGRSRELTALDEAFQAARDGTLTMLLLEGESGVGKSALMRRFLESIVEAEPEIVVLAGRCHERETVPYKAVDGVVDALSQYLTGLPPESAARLLPDEVGLIAQLFPVLRRVQLLEAAPEFALPLADSGHMRAVGELDAQERRTRAFAALRELLSRLTRRQPVVVAIDDFQWADADSLTLLAEVLRPPDAPPLLVVGTWRTSDDSATRPRLRLPIQVQRLLVEPLPTGDARALVAELLGRSGRRVDERDALAVGIAEEAGGHPLFIDELIRSRAVAASAAGRSLEDVLWLRICELEPRARRLLELVAVSGTPMSQEVAAQALSVSFPECSQMVAELKAANLVRTTGVRRGDRVEPFHDRVRETVIDHLDDPARRRWHGRLALALEAADPAGAEALATHWREAGDGERAATYAWLAGDQAARAFAFARAANLYRRALELRPISGLEGCALRTRLGDALTNAGRGADAAQAYHEAAAHTDGDDALELNRRAAEQLLRSGHIDEGLAAMRSVLARLGMALPTTQGRALASLLHQRARLRLRGLGYRPRPTSGIARDALVRIDTCWSVAVGLSVVDPVRGLEFQTRHAILALDAGDELRVVRALAAEVCYFAAIGDEKRELRVRTAARELAERLRDPYMLGYTTMACGIADGLAGRWRGARTHCEHAEELFRRHCAGVAWEVDNVHLFLLWALYCLGEIKVLRDRTMQLIHEAEERGDLYAVTTFRAGIPNMAWLAMDDPRGASAQVIDGMRNWSQRGFHSQHYYQLMSQTNIDLYIGNPQSALRRVTESWAAFEGSMLPRFEATRIDSAQLHARAAIAAAVQASGSERQACLETAARFAKRLRRERRPWAHAGAELLFAGIAFVGGQPERALERLRDAESRFDALDMPMHAATARRHFGAVIGGDAGARAVAEADRWLAEQEIARPDRWTSMLAPGFDR